MRPLDWGVLVAYAALVLLIGWRARRHGDDPLLAGRSIPAWAALCSLIATELSAATFIGVPHAAYLGDWSYLQLVIGSALGRLAVASWMIGLYHRLDLVTVYGLLGRRFGRKSQRCAAWLFLVGRVLASGVRLFIAALAFATVTGASVELAIVATGVIATTYTRVGGIEAVIATDVLQGAVFLIAALVTLVALLGLLDGGAPALLAAAGAAGKTAIVHLPVLSDISGTSADAVWGQLGAGLRALLGRADSLPAALVGGVFLALAAQGTDQDLVQRLLATRDGRGGARAMAASGFASIPVVLLFLLLGTCLWGLHDPSAALTPAGAFPAPVDDKRVLPEFALLYLPAGLRGLLFAGLFAAAMSSLDSAINALATSWVVDLREAPVARREAVLGRATLVFSALLITAALLFVRYEQQTTGLSLVELALSAMSVVYGGLLGGFLTALLTPTRGRDGSVRAGMLVGAAVGLALFLQPLWTDGPPAIAWPWWIPIGALVSLSIGALPRRAGQ